MSLRIAVQTLSRRAVRQLHSTAGVLAHYQTRIVQIENWPPESMFFNATFIHFTHF